jgi:hypothetical protein
MGNSRHRAFGATCAALLLAGCGGRSVDTETPWDRMDGCLADKGVLKLVGIPPTGSYAPSEEVPLNFADAPGGWLIADLAGGQKLGVFFYDDAAAAKRAQADVRSPDTRPGGTMGNVIYVFDEKPTPEERALLQSCLDGNAHS